MCGASVVGQTTREVIYKRRGGVRHIKVEYSIWDSMYILNFGGVGVVESFKIIGRLGVFLLLWKLKGRSWRAVQLNFVLLLREELEQVLQ